MGWGRAMTYRCLQRAECVIGADTRACPCTGEVTHFLILLRSVWLVTLDERAYVGNTGVEGG
jgi:hypothetical protein